MRIEQIKNLGIERNDVIGYTIDPRIEKVKETRLVYFLELVEKEKYAREWKEGHKDTPYIEVASHKDKNGVPKNILEVRLEEILHLTKIGKSKLVM